MPTLLTLVTKEGPILHFKETLCCLSETIHNLLIDFPNVTELEVTITKHQLELAFNFLDTLQSANNKADWKDLITGLEYLQITPRYQELLLEDVKKFLSNERIGYSYRISPIDALKKLCNPNHKTVYEIKEEHRQKKLNRIAACNHKDCFLNCPQRDLENLGLVHFD